MKLNKFGDLSRRFSISIGLLIVITLLVIFATNPVVSVILVLSVAYMAGVGVWEYGKLAVAKGLKPFFPLMIIVAACEVVAFFIGHKWIHSQELPFLVIASGLGLFFLNRFRQAEGALVHVAVEFFGVVYVSVPLSYALAILYPIAPSIQDGRWWLFYLILVTKVTDVGAYFIGKGVGKSPLAPQLSPKKTIEGAVAGLVCAILLSLAMVFLGREFAGSSFPLKYLDALWLGILIGIFGQIGDLAESLLKRDAVVKDSNRLPGLGGVLDMVDSLIFTAPIVYFYLKFL